MVIAALHATKAKDTTIPPKQMPSSGELSHNSVIQSLTKEIAILEKSVDSWNDRYIVFLVLSIIVAALTLFAQFKTIRTARTLSDKQAGLDSEKDRQLRSELSERDASVLSEKYVA